MADINIRNDPAFNNRMVALEPLDPVHADYYNIRFQQLLENDTALNVLLKSIVPITLEEIDMIDDIMLEVENFEGDISADDIRDILNN